MYKTSLKQVVLRMFVVFKQQEFDDIKRQGCNYIYIYYYIYIYRVVPFSSNSDHKHPHNRQLCDTADPLFLQLLYLSLGPGVFSTQMIYNHHLHNLATPKINIEPEVMMVRRPAAPAAPAYAAATAPRQRVGKPKTKRNQLQKMRF